jgi:hypothetical protein
MACDVELNQIERVRSPWCCSGGMLHCLSSSMQEPRPSLFFHDAGAASKLSTTVSPPVWVQYPLDPCLVISNKDLHLATCPEVHTLLTSLRRSKWLHHFQFDGAKLWRGLALIQALSVLCSCWRLLAEASIHVTLLWGVALTLLALLLILTYVYIWTREP